MGVETVDFLIGSSPGTSAEKTPLLTSGSYGSCSDDTVTIVKDAEMQGGLDVPAFKAGSSKIKDKERRTGCQRYYGIYWLFWPVFSCP